MPPISSRARHLGRSIAHILLGGALIGAAAFGAAVPASAASAPTVPAVASTTPTEVGVEFVANSTTTVTGLTFYRSAASKASAVSLWDEETGRRVTTGTAPITGVAGPVSATFAKAVTLQKGESLIASFYAPKGGWSETPGAFSSPVTVGTITYPAGAGLLSDGAGRIPSIASTTSSSYGIQLIYAGSDASPSPTPTPTPVGAPTITATGSTSTSVSLAWNSASIASGTQYTIKWGTTAAADQGSRTVVASTGNGATISGLAPNTKYFLTVAPTSAPANRAAVQVTTKPATTTPPTPGQIDIPVRVGVLGDSNSNGHKGHLATGMSLGWAPIVQNKGYITFAGGWANSGAGVDRLLQNTPDLSDADVVSLMIGTNDLAKNMSPAEFEAKLVAIVAKSGNSRIVLNAIPPWNGLREKVGPLNVLLAQIAARQGWAYVDAWAEVRNPDNSWKTGSSQGDGLHATKDGYAVYGAALERFIAQRYAGVTVP
ncbi:DUF4082 domain-containing protein [Microbacterium sp. P07]|uniref:DUF4082 domain-containing protein n=1 Tax=Microbacterium sp. P07 TaxID=3366952 RepID=UPI003744E162